MPETIIKLYFFRMEIEEGFRDLKSSQFGFSFEKAYSSKIRRIQILLMIAMLAAYILFIIGWGAEIKKWHYQFQANTIKSRRVLSVFYLGGRVINKKKRIRGSLIALSFHELHNSVRWGWEEKIWGDPSGVAPLRLVEVWRHAPRVDGVPGLPYHRSIWAQEVTIFKNVPSSAILDLRPPKL